MKMVLNITKTPNLIKKTKKQTCDQRKMVDLNSEETNAYKIRNRTIKETITKKQHNKNNN